MKTKMMHPTQLEKDQPFGFRIKPDGELELMTGAEVHAVIARALNEAVGRALRGRTVQ